MSLPTDPVDALRRAPFNLRDDAVTWVRSTRDAMDTDTRLRQLFNVSSFSDDPADIAALASQRVGAVTRFGGADRDQAWRATQALLDDAEVPPLISNDLEGGAIGLRYGTPLPNPLGLAACGDAGATRAAIEVAAAEARAVGYDWSFTPVIDINAAFRSAIVATRSYGRDVDTIEAHAVEHVRTFQRLGIACTAKHWPGEGFDDRDQHLVTTINPLGLDDWQATYGRLYRALIDAGVMCVMSAHIAWPAYAKAHGVDGLEACRPATVSALLNEQLLRRELGFNGLIVSDATGMAGLTSWAAREQFVPEVIANGCDMLLFPRDVEQEVGWLHDALRDGRLAPARVNEAVTRVLGLKAALGLHRRPRGARIAPLEEARRVIRQPAHQAVADDLAGRGITCVKDVRGLLPLSPGRHRRVVLVTDPLRRGFAKQAPEPLRFGALLAERGFEVRPYDPEHPPTAADTDLLLYVMAQESLLTVSHIYLDFERLQGPLGLAMRRWWHELPCALVSFGHPYHLYDVPRMPCVVNAYSSVEPVQRATVARLLGDAPFTGRSPVDATCGLPDAMY